MLRLFFISVLMLLIPLTAINTEAQKVIARSNPLFFSIDSNYKCQVVSQAFVTAPHIKYFQDDMNKVKILVNSAANSLRRKECPRLGRLDVIGLVNKKQVYSGYISIAEGWVLKREPIWDKASSALRTRTAGKPYINTFNELVVYDSGPIVISSPYKSRFGRLKLSKNIDTLDAWSQRRMQAFILEYDCDLTTRNSYFDQGFENFFMNKIFPRIKSLYDRTGAKHEHQTYSFWMRKKNETAYWDSFNLSVTFKSGTLEIKSLKKSYSMHAARNHIKGKEREDLFYKMNRRYLVNIPGKAIYEDDLIQIQPHHSGKMVNYKIGRAGWCDKAELNIIYKMPLKERDKKVTFEYLSPIVFKILKQQCSVPAYVKLYFYPENEANYWDSATYQYCRLLTANEQCHENNTRLEYGVEGGRMEGPLQILTLAKKYRDNPYYMWECEDGMFCDLPGGKYLTAIYENDIYTIKEMDHLAYRELIGALRGFQTKTGLWQLGVDFTNKVKPVSLILEVANQYMYHYRFNNRQCLRSNAYTRTYSHTADTIRYENMYGMDMGSVGGWTASTTYWVNSEFRPLLNQLGKFALFADIEIAAKYHKLRGLERTGQDVKALQKRFNCNSAVIKQFEKNLISLATKYLKNGNTFGKKSVKKFADKAKAIAGAKKKDIKQPSRLPVPPPPNPGFSGSWKGTINNQPIELVLWSRSSDYNSFAGFAYAPGYDCLMLAIARKETSLFTMSFMSNPQLVKRPNNCVQNTSELTGIDVSGYLSFNKNSGILIFKTLNIYMGKKISHGEERRIEFKRNPVSSKMIELINEDNKENRIAGRPDAELLAGMIKDGGQLYWEKQKKVK